MCSTSFEGSLYCRSTSPIVFNSCPMWWYHTPVWSRVNFKVDACCMILVFQVKLDHYACFYHHVFVSCTLLFIQFTWGLSNVMCALAYRVIFNVLLVRDVGCWIILRSTHFLAVFPSDTGTKVPPGRIFGAHVFVPNFYILSYSISNILISTVNHISCCHCLLSKWNWIEMNFNLPSFTDCR